ncbi:MAG: site-specific integrase [Bacteroidota bacterium]
MAKYNFNLRDWSSTKETPINLVIRWNNKRLVFPTNERINPKFWNLKTQSVKEKAQIPEFPEFNTRLDRIKSRAKDLFRRFQNDNDQRQPSFDELREILYTGFSDKNTPQKINLFQFFDQFINESKNKVNEKTGKMFSSATIQTYQNAKTVLQAYQTAKRIKINFNSIDLDFYIDFTEYLTKEKRYSTNTIGKHIKILKTVLNEATERGINESIAFKSKRFRVITEKTESVYLSERELQELYNLDLSDDTKLERVRDLFIVGCWTGLRFSDFSKIQPENIIKNKDGEFLEIETQKTREPVVIPIHWTVKEILNKYNGTTQNSLPRALSNQKMNAYLKKIGETKEIMQELTTHTKTKGGMNVSKMVKKYELITTHTARRSFSTNAYLDGVPIITIMKITGHKTEKAFMRYIKITPNEHAKILQLHWQRKQGLKVV